MTEMPKTFNKKLISPTKIDFSPPKTLVNLITTYKKKPFYKQLSLNKYT